jgi:hypothetical protein
LAIAFTLVCLAAHPITIQAETPVLVLHRTAPGHSSMKLQSVHAEPYPYGYFGAQTNPHWSRHYGYYNTYRQWTRR